MNVLHVTTDTGETDIVRRELSAVDPDLRVECAGTPREAIARLEGETSHYDAVLLDLTHMNGEGPSLVSHIRKNNLPVGVVAITSAREEGSSREALNCGADRIVVKDKEFLTHLPAVLAQAVERRTLEARLRIRLETAPACLMRVAGDGTILALNIATLKMIDAKWADQVVDQSWFERVEPDDQAACRDFIERAANGERGSFECQIEGLSGTQRTVLMHAVRAPVAASGVPSALVVMLDLDDTRGLEAALEQYRQELGVVETALSEIEAQNQQLSADHEAERAAWEQHRAAWEQAEATRRQALVDEHQAAHEATQSALASADAKYQQLSADHEAERAAWEQQRAARQAQERASIEQQGAEREKLESALKAAVAQCQRLSTDLVSERAAWEQAEATRRQALVDEHRAAHEAFQSALASADAKYQQLSADHEAERAAWEQTEATRRQALVDEYQAAHEAFQSALASTDAKYQQLSADHEAERAAWEQQRAAWKQPEATRRQALVDEHQAAHEAFQSALASTDAEYQQLSADHEAERAAWEQQRAAGQARERASVEQHGAEREKLESALKAADARCQQLSTDLTAERAAWEQADATRRRGLVDEHQAAHEASQSALASADAKYQQLSADHEAERAAWEQQRAAWQAQERASVEQQDAEREKLEKIRQRHRLESAQQAAASRALQDPACHGQSPETVASLRTMDLSAAIGQLGPILRRLVGENIEFEVEPASQLDPGTINPDHVEQLLLRLALVLREAMPAGGIVRLGTSNVEIDDAHVREYPGVPPGQYARLTLRASGWGMDPQVQDRVSSAVASGENSEEAKQLGLASALRAFRQAGGHIAAEAEPGRMLTFDGYLPTVASKRSSCGVLGKPELLHGGEAGRYARSEREIR